MEWIDGPTFRELIREGKVERRAGDRLGWASGARLGGGARGWNSASRYQAGEHHPWQRRCCEDSGFRSRPPCRAAASGGEFCRGIRNDIRYALGNAAVHAAGTVSRRTGDQRSPTCSRWELCFTSCPRAGIRLPAKHRWRFSRPLSFAPSPLPQASRRDASRDRSLILRMLDRDAALRPSAARNLRCTQ